MRRWLALAALLLPAAAQAEPHEMVAAAHPLGVEAGLDVLRRGGSAIDAAVAVQMMLAVVEPQSSGLGGGGFLLYYDATTRSITVYDGRETAPAGATATMFQKDGKPLPFLQAVASGLSVGVPGAVSLLEMAQREHGKLPWPDLFGSSIAAARKGFAVSPRLADWLAKMKHFADDPAARALYYRDDGAPRQAGDIVTNPDLADTMQRVAREGSRVLREGPIAEAMVARVHGHVRPGTLALTDLAAYKAVKREPLCGPYRIWIVCGMPPPSSGGIAILQMLGLLEPFDLAKDKPNDLRAIHLIAEASRLAFADRDHYVDDPAFDPVPTRELVAPAYIARRRTLISEERSMGEQGRVPPGYPEHGTTHISIVDRDGNAVAFTTTIEAPFGSHMMVAGFILNNELTDFSAMAERDGKPVANRVEPGKRPRSSMSPTFVLDRDRQLVLTVGSAGGARIIGDTLQALVGMLDWNLSPQAALDLPRVINMNGPTELEDKGGLPALADGLRKLGHQVQVRRHEGGLTAIRRKGDGWEGGADPRRDGVAKGD
jgi:gamma-glutamyltranspeptidase/glutathione hydrolase